MPCPGRALVMMPARRVHRPGVRRGSCTRISANSVPTSQSPWRRTVREGEDVTLTSGPHRGQDTPSASEGRTILVVEDDVDLRNTLRFALEDEGFAVERAGDGVDALRRIRQRAPDLIILDLNMPRM